MIDRRDRNLGKRNPLCEPAVALAATLQADSPTSGGAVAKGSGPSNRWISARLRDYAGLLEQQGADGFRERAYRRAADTVIGLKEPVRDVLASKGIEGLISLPGIGKGIARAIAEMIVSGRWSQLERLRGELSPEKLIQTIPGIGPELARRLADDAHLESLEELESALYLHPAPVRGLGPRRREAIAAVLSQRLGRPTAQVLVAPATVPPVRTLLKIDAMYRERAAAGQLRLIAPKRFNPSGRAWLPVMHVKRDGWQFTALFSNTARAHQLARTHDWVVIYYQDSDHAEGRCTVVSETRGPSAGKRVIRGRESECGAS